MPYSYLCREFPELEACPGEFYAATEEELWQHMDLHARLAHQEDPSAWPDHVTALCKGLIRTDRPNSTTVIAPSA